LEEAVGWQHRKLGLQKQEPTQASQSAYAGGIEAHPRYAAKKPGFTFAEAMASSAKARV
jgi:hypothetical protein